MFQIGSFQVQEKLFESTNTLVFRALQSSDKPGKASGTVILKQLKQQFPSPEQLARFRREFEISKRIGGKGIVKATQLLRHENSLVMVMEDIHGDSLANLYKDKAMRVAEFLRFALKLVDCIDAVHQHKIIHKDINPSNIILDKRTQRLKVIDFGISSELEYEAPSAVGEAIFKGTFAYISPEQTGRMNRGVDYRTDFYSLGVTFYQLLTGKLPYTAEDPMEWVHAHIAKTAADPTQINPDIPEALSKVVLKLLAKNADDRYATLFGLKRDLEHCRREFSSLGMVKPFELGTADYSGEFNVSKQVVGRDSELDTLFAAYDKAESGNNQIVTVSGSSGVGKTALVHEVKKPVMLKRGYFVEGKFDQFNRTSPYSAIINVIKGFILQILTETESEIAAWQNSFDKSLDGFGHLLLDAIPELRHITDTVAAAANDGIDLDNKFSLALQKVFSAITQRNKPIVIFLDDLQWADLASLKLLKGLCISQEVKRLLLIMAYRDNEVSAAHPFIQTLNDMSSAGIKCIDLEIEPLSANCLNQILSNSLRMEQQTCRPLANLCHSKTLGNPFYFNQFLINLHENKEIVFNKESYHWSWDLARIKRTESAANVVDLMVGKLKQLSPDSLRLLQIASIMGAQFDLGTLVNVSQSKLETAAKQLFEALQAELISPLNDSYKWVQFLELSDTDGYQDVIQNQRPRYKFIHDKVQQAAYATMVQSERHQMHLKIGNSLLQNLNTNEPGDLVFEVANHFNNAGNQGNDEAILRQRLECNVAAARQAKLSAAINQAQSYISHASEVLKQQWQAPVAAITEYYLLAAELACISADYYAMDEFCQRLVEHDRSNTNRLMVAELKILQLIAEHKSAEAVEVGREALKVAGFELPSEATDADVQQTLLATMDMLRKFTTEQLLSLPTISDGEMATALRILNQITSPSYQSSPLLFPIIVCNMVQLSCRHGNSASSCFAYASYGLLLNGLLGSVDDAQTMAKLAVKLVHKLRVPDVECMTQYVCTAFIEHFKQPLSGTVTTMHDNYQLGITRGDNEYACWSAMMELVHGFYAGQSIADLSSRAIPYIQVMQEVKQETASIHMSIFAQLLETLRKEGSPTTLLQGTYYDEAKAKQVHVKANDSTALAILGMMKIHISFLHQDYSKVIAVAEDTQSYLSGVVSSVYVPNFHFYCGLANAQLQTRASGTSEQFYLENLMAHIAQLRQWHDAGCSNVSTKYFLLNAEYKALTEGFSLETVDAYEQAVAAAREEDFIQEEAVANEMFMHFWQRHGKTDIAKLYLEKASHLYQVWGCVNKVQQLQKEYSQYFTAANTPVPRRDLKTQGTIGVTEVRNLDLTSVMKASQAISKEIVRDKLLKKMMILVLENAGAQTGKLVLANGATWKLAASADIESGQVQLLDESPVDLIQDPRIPIHILQYVHRTKDAVVFSVDDGQEQFHIDNYIRQHAPKSVLCLPIMHRNQVDGFLYLENNLLQNAFTEERLEIIKLLTSQMVISLENADLYAELENRVKERTASLNEANEKLTLLATTDSLTGANTRRHFMELANRELGRSKRSDGSIVVMMLDIDHFKSVNDTYGHAAGDTAIKKVVSICMDTLRPTDIFGRLGGEEFAIVLAESNMDIGKMVAERIRSKIETTVVECGELQFSVRVSIGLTQSGQTPKNMEQLLQLADEALYQAKHEGRNQVIGNFEG